MRNPISISWRAAALYLLGGALLVLVCFGLIFGEGPRALADSLVGLAAVSAACLIAARSIGSSAKSVSLDSGIEEPLSAPDAVRASEAEWREVFEHNPVMYFMVDSAEIVLSVNSFGAAQLGYSVDELLGRSVLTVFREDDRATVQRNVAACLDNIGQTRSWEIRKVRKDGSQIWVRENAKAVRRANDQQIVLIACEDITDRVQAENALRRNEMYLAEAQRLSHTGSFGWHVGTGEIVWSEETFSIFGYDKDSLITLEMMMERVHPDDRSGVARTIEQASRDGRDFQHFYRLSLPGGRTKHVHAVARAARSDSGEMVFIGAVTDITARKLIEAELRESEQRFRDYAETASDWFWETDPDHRLTTLSHEGGIVSGRIGGLAWEYAADLEEEPQKWRLHFDDLAARRPFRNFRYRVSAPDGMSSYVETSGKPVFDANGRYLGYRGVASDVTAAARAEHAEEALREAQANLERVTRVTTLGELTASIAHEVNQPLAAVVANAAAGLRWLDRETPDVPEARRSLQMVMDDANRAGEVIRRVRGLVKKGAIEKVPLDLNEVVREVTGLVQQQLSNRRVALRLDLDPALPSVRADRVQLQQLLLNLVINAMEAMEQVTDRSLELSIRTMRDDAGQVVLTVRDCGVGIDGAVAHRLFDAFFTTKGSGMGMGLSICRSIIEAHGGRLTASPNDGPGATFGFTLPPCREGVEA